MRSVVLVGVLVPTLALAVDVNPADGCEDSYADANGACVDPSATVDASAIVGARAVVGPGVPVEANVVIGAKANFAGDSDSGAPQRIGAGTVVGRRAAFGFDANLGTGNTIARAVSAGNNVTFGNNNTIGYGVVLGDGVTLGNGATVANLATVGDHATIGDNAVVGRGTTLMDGAGAGLGANVQGRVGAGATIHAGATVHPLAKVRRGATIHGGAIVEDGAVVGRGATVHANAVVKTGGVVRAGGEVCDGATVNATDTVGRGGTWPASGCVAPTTCKALFDGGYGTTDGEYTVNPSGSNAFPVFCDMTNGGWTMLGKASDGSAEGFGTVFLGGNANVTTPGYLDRGAEAASYANPLAGADWSNGGFTEARIEIWDGGVMVRSIEFSFPATATNASWFTKANITNVTGWTDLSPTSTIDPPMSVAPGRDFYISHNHGGCQADAGWLVIPSGNSCVEWHNPARGHILYSAVSTYTDWSAGTVPSASSAHADVFIVFAR